MSLKFVKQPKTDCFAYDSVKKNCKALSELVCSCKNKCAFYRDRESVNMREIEWAIKHYAYPTKEDFDKKGEDS